MLSPLEVVMLICFGASWPVSVFRTWHRKRSQDKSLLFLALVFTGYVSGVLHKVFFNYDLVILLYMFNAVLVFTDLMLSCYYRRYPGGRQAQVLPVSS